MAVGGPGRLLPAGGGEDGRFPEGAPRLQQEQLQQIPCGFRLQGFQPSPLGVFAHQRIPLGTDHRDREDKHPPALPPPAVGQKECSQKTGSGAGGAGRREFRAAPENRPDREPRHDRGHLKLWEFPGNFPRLLPGFFFCFVSSQIPFFFSVFCPPTFRSPRGPNHSDFPGFSLFILGFASLPFFVLFFFFSWDFFFSGIFFFGGFFFLWNFFLWDLIFCGI